MALEKFEHDLFSEPPVVVDPAVSNFADKRILKKEEEVVVDSDSDSDFEDDELLFSSDLRFDLATRRLQRLRLKYEPYFRCYINGEDLCDCSNCLTNFSQDPKGVLSLYGVELREKGAKEMYPIFKEEEEEKIESPSSVVSPFNCRLQKKYNRKKKMVNLDSNLAKEKFSLAPEDEATRALKTELVETIVLGTRPPKTAQQQQQHVPKCVLKGPSATLSCGLDLGHPILHGVRNYSAWSREDLRSVNPRFRPRRSSNRGGSSNIDDHKDHHLHGSITTYRFRCLWPGCERRQQIEGDVVEWNVRRHIRTVHLGCPVTKWEAMESGLDVKRIEEEEDRWLQVISCSRSTDGRKKKILKKEVKEEEVEMIEVKVELKEEKD